MEKISTSYIDTRKSVERDCCCDRFVRRRSLLAMQPSCWVCRYAWFGEDKNKIPEKGICKYPEWQTN